MIMTDQDLGLPVDHYFRPGKDDGRWGSALVCTICPATAGSGDRQQGEVLAVLAVLENDDETDDSLIDLARFITAALHAYASTRKGLAQWKAVHALLVELRNAAPPPQDPPGPRGS